MYRTVSQKLKLMPVQFDTVKRIAGCCRYVHNHFLARLETNLVSYDTCRRELKTQIRQNAWLQEAYEPNLMYMLRDMYKKFRYGGAKDKPRYLSKYKTIAFRVFNVAVEGNSVIIPSIGKVKCRGLSKRIGIHPPLSATIIVSPDGYCELRILINVDEDYYPPPIVDKIGVDYGIRTVLTLSNGLKFSIPKRIKKLYHKMEYYQKKCNSAQRLSNNYWKWYRKLQSTMRRLHNCLNGYAHTVAHILTAMYNEIVIEKLSIKHIIKHSKGSICYIMRSGLPTFYRWLQYMCIKRGRKFTLVDANYPSTKLCSTCGYKNNNIRGVHIHKWVCPSCGTRHDRDVNAAVNMYNYSTWQLHGYSP